ncbi:hypothetical protein AB4Y77_17620 [Paenarthrobacter sp. YAF11_1]|uniref:hypothetical protein n=1 Tax=Paenarthrobacter sp. YAF11_1 TaxID=3233074 RepID=UPI003F966E2D
MPDASRLAQLGETLARWQVDGGPVHLHPGDHRGRGYGVEITRAGATVLREMGSSSAMVAAEGANKGALATYLAAGFVPATPVVDMSRGDH